MIVTSDIELAKVKIHVVPTLIDVILPGDESDIAFDRLFNDAVLLDGKNESFAFAGQGESQKYHSNILDRGIAEDSSKVDELQLRQSLALDVEGSLAPLYHLQTPISQGGTLTADGEIGVSIQFPTAVAQMIAVASDFAQADLLRVLPEREYAVGAQDHDERVAENLSTLIGDETISEDLPLAMRDLDLEKMEQQALPAAEASLVSDLQVATLTAAGLSYDSPWPVIYTAPDLLRADLSAIQHDQLYQAPARRTPSFRAEASEFVPVARDYTFPRSHSPLGEMTGKSTHPRISQASPQRQMQSGHFYGPLRAVAVDTLHAKLAASGPGEHQQPEAIDPPDFQPKVAVAMGASDVADHVMSTAAPPLNGVSYAVDDNAERGKRMEEGLAPDFAGDSKEVFDLIRTNRSVDSSQAVLIASPEPVMHGIEGVSEQTISEVGPATLAEQKLVVDVPTENRTGPTFISSERLIPSRLRHWALRINEAAVSGSAQEILVEDRLDGGLAPAEGKGVTAQQISSPSLTIEKQPDGAAPPRHSFAADQEPPVIFVPGPDGPVSKIFTLQAESDYGPRQVVPQLAQSIMQVVKTDASGTVSLQLTPQELGAVRFDVGLQGESIHLSIAAERPEIMDLLRRNLDQLFIELKQSGLSSCTFSFGQWEQRKTAPQVAYQLEAAVEEMDQPIYEGARVQQGRLNLRF